MNKNKLDIHLGVKDGLFRSGLKSSLAWADKKVNQLGRKMGNSLARAGKGTLALGASGGAMALMVNEVAKTSDAFDDLAEKSNNTDLHQLQSQVFELNRSLALGSAKEAAHLLTLTSTAAKGTNLNIQNLAYSAGMLGKKFDDHEGTLRAQIELHRQFGASNRESADSLAYLAAQGGDQRGELLETLLEYSVQAKEAGLNLHQMVGAVGAGLGESWSIDKTLDALKESRLLLYGGDKKTVDALKILGLEGLEKQVQSGAVEFAVALGQIGDKLSQKSGGIQFQAATGIFGTQWEDAGSDAILAMTAGMNKKIELGGEFDKLSLAASSRFSHKWRKGIAEMDNAKSAFETNVLPLFDPLVDKFTLATKTATEFIQKYKHISLAVAVGAGGIALGAAALGTLALAGGIAGAGIAILTSPITLAVGLVAGLAYGLYALDEKTGIISKTFSAFVTQVSPQVAKLTDAAGDAFDGIMLLADKGISALSSLNGETEIFTKIGSAIGMVAELPLAYITGVFKSLAELPQLFDSASEFIEKKDFESLLALGKNLGTFFFNPLAELADTTIGTNISGAFTSLFVSVGTETDLFIAKFDPLLAIPGQFSLAWDSNMLAMTKSWDDLKLSIVSIPDDFGLAWDRNMSSLKKSFSDLPGINLFSSGEEKVAPEKKSSSFFSLPEFLGGSDGKTVAPTTAGRQRRSNDAEIRRRDMQREFPQSGGKTGGDTYKTVTIENLHSQATDPDELIFRVGL
ncbi:MAG: hypothetical protein JKX96_09480 [Acinetobacter sp.]|nr:hypothetical protein [Acinetobacter sp.]